MPIRIATPASDEDWADGRRMIEAYAASQKLDRCFEGLADELARIESEYGPPAGAFLLGYHRDAAVGCVGLRRYADGIGEMKRLYVDDAARGRGLGAALTRGILAEARRLGYHRVVLDTLPTMTTAHALYRSLGFEATSAYRFNPVEGTLFMAITLG
jgi:GNAT superfamily N-acetyltransferase